MLCSAGGSRHRSHAHVSRPVGRRCYPGTCWPVVQKLHSHSAIYRGDSARYGSRTRAAAADRGVVALMQHGDMHFGPNGPAMVDHRYGEVVHTCYTAARLVAELDPREPGSPSTMPRRAQVIDDKNRARPVPLNCRPKAIRHRPEQADANEDIEIHRTSYPDPLRDNNVKRLSGDFS